MTLRLVALLSWYDETSETLQRCVTSLKALHVDHVVALDGAYALYPDGRPMSHPDQATMIRASCSRISAGCTVETPETVWQGNEIEKRNHLFRLGERHTTDKDWFVVFDADETARCASPDVKARLAATPFDVGAVTLHEAGHPFGTVTFQTFPMFFRAIRGLSVQGNHFTYVTPDGRKLWGDARRDRLEPRADLTDIVVEHHKQFSPQDRRRAAERYYQARDDAGVEGLDKDRSVLAA